MSLGGGLWWEMGLDILGHVWRIQEGCVRQQLERCGGSVTVGHLWGARSAVGLSFSSVTNAISHLECHFRIDF